MSLLSIIDAIKIAIESIEDRSDIPESIKTQAIDKLKKLQARDWYNCWDEESIIAALQEYKNRTGLIPTYTSLKEHGMPKPQTIQSVFHMKASDLINNVFHDDILKARSELIECFICQYNKNAVAGINSKKYNMLRDKGTPTWEAIARNCGVSTWKELIEIAGVQYRPKDCCTSKMVITNASSPYMENLIKLNKERERLNGELVKLLHAK